MVRSRVAQPTVTRSTRSSSSQARAENPKEHQESKPNIKRQKRTDTTLFQDLRHMDVAGQEVLLRSGEKVSSADRDPEQALGSTFGQSNPSLQMSWRGLTSVARLVKQGRCKNIVVVAGAGISTASGIPDFRTPGTGLYANLEKYNIPYPEAIFNIDYFSNNPQPFFSLAKALYPGEHRPNYIHYFIHMLHLKGLLLRMYTQNIDGLEKLCGIPEEKLVEAHGSFATASCHLCYTPYPAEEAKRAIITGNIPTCSFCSATVKPDVVFFGEDLPQKYSLHTKDFPKADLLIVMGTSLQIEPFASLVNTVRSTVPRLLLNRHAVGPFERIPLRRVDHMALGDLTQTVKRFAEMLGWNREIEELMRSEKTLADHEKIPKLMSYPLSDLAASKPGSSVEMLEFRPGGAAGSCEEIDSETDSKSSASSN